MIYLMVGQREEVYKIRLGLEGNLCRCTGYHNIVKSVQYAAKHGADGSDTGVGADEEVTA